jgi:hypothetical protein
MKRPDIKDFFPPDTDIPSALKVYKSQPELFNYVKALDSYIDFMSESPTLSQVEVLTEALKQIAQMSDPGSYEGAIVDMKQIASKTLSNIESLNSK